jgi:hypothetical protein
MDQTLNDLLNDLEVVSAEKDHPRHIPHPPTVEKATANV